MPSIFGMGAALVVVAAWLAAWDVGGVREAIYCTVRKCAAAERRSADKGAVYCLAMFNARLGEVKPINWFDIRAGDVLIAVFSRPSLVEMRSFGRMTLTRKNPEGRPRLEAVAVRTWARPSYPDGASIPDYCQRYSYVSEMDIPTNAEAGRYLLRVDDFSSDVDVRQMPTR